MLLTLRPEEGKCVSVIIYPQDSVSYHPDGNTESSFGVDRAVPALAPLTHEWISKCQNDHADSDTNRTKLKM